MLVWITYAEAIGIRPLSSAIFVVGHYSVSPEESKAKKMHCKGKDDYRCMGDMGW